VRVMPLRVLSVGYCPVRNLCSSASWPSLPGVELSQFFTKLRVIGIVVPLCLSRSFSPTVDMVDL
jgi:hypothetical protein